MRVLLLCEPRPLCPGRQAPPAEGHRPRKAQVCGHDTPRPSDPPNKDSLIFRVLERLRTDMTGLLSLAFVQHELRDAVVRSITRSRGTAEPRVQIRQWN